MKTNELKNYVSKILVKNAHDRKRLNALNKLIGIVESHNIKLDTVRSTPNGNINGGDLVECIVKALYNEYKHRQNKTVKISNFKSRDMSINWLNVEIKGQLNNQNLATYTQDANTARRFIGVVFDGLEFQVKTFTKENIITTSRGKDLKLHLIESQPVEACVNKFADWLEMELN